MLTVRANPFDRMWSEWEQEYLAAVRRVGASGWYILGREVEHFEKELAAYCESWAAVGCGNGLDAIEIALRVSGIGAGDRVLTTPLSAFATGLAIIRAGARPVFCDVDENGLMDPEAAATAFERHPDIRAIVVVHLYGHLADMQALSALASLHGVSLIEDAAQAIGARRGETRVGQLGHIACFSFYPTKNLGVLGDGGAMIFANDGLASYARSLRDYGQSARYVHSVIGLNSRLDEIHAATLTHVFLPRLDGWLAQRRAVAQRYLYGIGNPAVRLLPGPDPAGSGWHLFPVAVDPARRKAFRAHLAAQGVDSGLHYPTLICDQKAYADLVGSSEPLALPAARRLANEEVSLPIHPYLTDEEVGHVIAAVNSWKG